MDTERTCDASSQSSARKRAARLQKSNETIRCWRYFCQRRHLEYPDIDNRKHRRWPVFYDIEPTALARVAYIGADIATKLFRAVIRSAADFDPWLAYG